MLCRYREGTNPVMLDHFMVSKAIFTNPKPNVRAVVTFTKEVMEESLKYCDGNNILASIEEQSLAAEIRKVMAESKPEILEVGEWHLPFVTHRDALDLMKMSPYDYEILTLGGIRDEEPPRQSVFKADEWMQEKLVNLSAFRCCMSTQDNGLSIEQELDVAKDLIEYKDWSCFEHQAQAIDEEEQLKSFREYMEHDLSGKMSRGPSMPNTGLSLHIDPAEGHWKLFSNNLEGWIQARALLEKRV